MLKKPEFPLNENLYLDPKGTTTLATVPYYFDENLRDIPLNPENLKTHVEDLWGKFKQQNSPTEQVRTLGEIGVYLRQLNELNEAENILSYALQLISQYNLGLKLETQLKIRIAHVYQWKKDFEKSTLMFSEVIQICRINNELDHFLAFALQHSGKNLFDQGYFQESLLYFDEALAVRLHKKAPDEQIESTRLAIKITKEKIKLRV